MRRILNQFNRFLPQRVNVTTCVHREEMKDDIFIDSESEMENLPREIQIEILSYLTNYELCTCRLLSRKWCNLIDADTIWLYKYQVTYTQLPSKPEWFKSWKDLFMAKTNAIKWDDKNRAIKTSLSADEMTIQDVPSPTDNCKWKTALAMPLWKKGVRYWEIRVDKLCPTNMNSIKIGFGLCNERPTLVWNCPFGYTYNGFNRADVDAYDQSCVFMADGAIMVNSNHKKSQEVWNVGDHVGMKGDWDKAKVTFYINGEQKGSVKLKCKKPFYIAVSLINGNQVTLQDIPKYYPL